MVEPDEVYLAVIRWQLARLDEGPSASPPTSGDGDDLPVVYVAAADGSKIDTNVQARVAHSTVDEAALRFADSRDQALEMDDETEPVIDGGVLLSIAPIEPDAAKQRTIEVVVYRSIDDQQTWLLTVDASRRQRDDHGVDTATVVSNDLAMVNACSASSSSTSRSGSSAF